MALTSSLIKKLRQAAHKLNPVVMVGNQGITTPVLKEVENTLRSHELIKIKIACDDQSAFQELVQEIIDNTNAEAVQTIGHILVLYRPGEKKRYEEVAAPKKAAKKKASTRTFKKKTSSSKPLAKGRSSRSFKKSPATSERPQRTVKYGPKR